MVAANRAVSLFSVAGTQQRWVSRITSLLRIPVASNDDLLCQKCKCRIVSLEKAAADPPAKQAFEGLFFYSPSKKSCFALFFIAYRLHISDDSAKDVGARKYCASPMHSNRTQLRFVPAAAQAFQQFSDTQVQYIQNSEHVLQTTHFLKSC